MAGLQAAPRPAQTATAGNTTEYFYCYEQLTGVCIPDGSTRAAGFDQFIRQT